MSMKIAITGEKGFVGLHLVNYFKYILKYEVIELGRDYLFKLSEVDELDWLIHGAFPIQSNPGKVTAEIISEGENGFLIENPNDDNAISNLIIKVLQQSELLPKAFEINQKIAKERLDYAVNQQKNSSFIPSN